MKFIDIHSHLNLPEFAVDIEEAIQRLRDTDTQTIVVGVDLETSKKAVELADKFDEVYACIGVHPVDNPNVSFEREKFEELVKHPKVVAIGECGLDFFRTPRSLGEVGQIDPEDFERQKKLFLDQINFAVQHDFPIMIHARDAYGELLEILEPLKETLGEKLRGDVHFFAGDLETAKRFIKVGFTLSFTGVITFTHDYDEVIKNIPLESIMSETDAPYVAPVPYRGKRNEPSYVSEVVKRIALIRGEDFEMVQKALIQNAERVFKITA